MAQQLSTFLSGFGPTGPTGLTGPTGPLSQGFIAGLTLSNDVTSPNTVIDIAVGSTTSDDNTTVMTLGSAYTKTTGTWAVGTGNGGLDTGTVAASTWYHVYVIERTDTGVVDVLLSLSATSPTMPTSYTKQRRLGSIKMDGSVHIIAFTQNGNRFDLVTPFVEMNFAPTVTTAVTETLVAVPTGVVVEAILSGNIFDTAVSNTILYISSLSQTDLAASGAGGAVTAQIGAPTTTAGGAFSGFRVMTNASAQIRRRVSTTTVNVIIITNGWIDSRGNAGTGIAVAITGPTGPSGGPTGPTGPTGPISALDVGRNKIHNPFFNIAQRGAGPFTTTQYILDRWLINVTTDTASYTQAALSDADRTAIGDEEALVCLQNVFTGNAAAGAFNIAVQRIENIYRLSGKTVTVSFWAKAASGTPKFGLSYDQAFGSGGSTTIFASGTSVTLSTTWTRYSVTFAIASASGKTVGTGNYTALNLWYSSGTTNATRSGSVGVQSGTFSLWGVQLEVGSTATQLEKPDPRYDLSNCQRFYSVGIATASGAYPSGGSGAVAYSPVVFPVTMRALPTLTQGATVVSVNLSAVAFVSVIPATGYMVVTIGSGAGNFVGSVVYTASADL